VALAKSLGGGMMPIGALLMRRELWMKAYGTVPSCTLHTSTFGGGSLACAAGLAALEVLEQERLCSNAQRQGEVLLEGLGRLTRQYRCLKQVRGRGLLLGLEFRPLPEMIKAHWHSIDSTGMSRFLAAEMQHYIDAFHVLHAMHTLLSAHRIYTQFTRSNPLVLRVEPPLNVTDEQVARFLDAVDKTCREIDFVCELLEEMIAKTSRGKHDATERAGSAAIPNPSAS
jgi:putrescine aminotransferase